MVNLNLDAYGQWVGEGNSLWRKNIITTTLSANIVATIVLLEHMGMDNPTYLTRSRQPHPQPHPIMAHVLDQHKLTCVEHRTRQPIMCDTIDIMLWLADQSSSSNHSGWTTSWTSCCDRMILSVFTCYYTCEYSHTDICSFDKCASGRGAMIRVSSPAPRWEHATSTSCVSTFYP
jgi:hypothetical protein